MPVELTLITDKRGCVIPIMDDRPISEPTPLINLPRLSMLEVDLFGQGHALMDALGGQILLNRLNADPDRLLLLNIDQPAHAIPWEYAILSDHHLLACRYGLLRLIDGVPASGNSIAAGPLQFVVLAADPLVDDRAQPRESYRLDLQNELREIRGCLEASGVALQGRRIAPTRSALRRALRRGPILLHLSCHGDIIKTDDANPVAVLFLEDDDGGQDILLGSELVALPPPGVLRLVVLNTCLSAAGDSSLARALVLGGVPAVIGMQGRFPDVLSDELVVDLYDCLLAGYSLNEALRQARQALQERDLVAAGLPVCYAARSAWAPLPLSPGRPQIEVLGLPGLCRLPPEVRPPRPLLGRNIALHALASLYSQGSRIVTVTGTAGVGKSALVAAFAERFAWRWSQGVLAISFASTEVDAAWFRGELLRGFLGEDAAQVLSKATDVKQAQALLDAVRNWDGLLLLDNYESVLQSLQAEEAGSNKKRPLAETHLPDPIEDIGLLRRLTRDAFTDKELRRLCEEQAFLRPVLTSFGSGFSLDDMIDAVITYCLKRNLIAELRSAVARANPRQYARHQLHSLAPKTIHAQDAWVVHRLVYQLAESGIRILLTSRQQPSGLVGEAVFPAPRTPLNGIAKDPGARLFLRHSARALSEGEAGQKLAAQIAVATEGHPLAITLLAAEYEQSALGAGDFLNEWEAALEVARHDGLAEHHRTFRVAFRRSYDTLSPVLQANLRALSIFAFPFFVEGAALVWGMDIDQETLVTTRKNLGTLVRANLLELAGLFEDGMPAIYRFQPALHQAVTQEAAQHPEEEEKWTAGYAAYGAWLCRQSYINIYRDVALNRLTRLSMTSLEAAIETLSGIERMWHIKRLAWLKRAYGDTAGACDLLTEALASPAHPRTEPEAIRAQSSLRYELARLYVTRGELDKALTLLGESLALYEQIGDIQGQAAVHHQTATVYRTRGELDQAVVLFEKCLTIDEQLDDPRGRAATQNQLAGVYLIQGDLDCALKLYQESLRFYDEIGDRQGKAVSLQNSAAVFRVRGELDRSLAHYEESLEISEQISNKKIKSESLANVGAVHLARGRPYRALELYQESLEICEQIGDRQGKASLLRQIAQAHRICCDLDRALDFCQESLEIAEKIGDIRGRAASLAVMARIHHGLGDINRALSLFRESLMLYEQVDDSEGKAACMHRLASIFMYCGDWYQAEHALEEALRLARKVGSLQHIAFALTKYGQVAEARGDRVIAHTFYTEGQSLFEQMGMPESQWVQALIADLRSAHSEGHVQELED